MAECKQCGKEYVAKRSTSAYCGPKCKQDFYRNRMKPVTVTSVTLRDAKPVTVTNAKQGSTVIPSESHVDASDIGAVKTLHRLIEIKPYQMTVVERLFYRPANKLGRGDTNFVSLPGRACYGVV